MGEAKKRKERDIQIWNIYLSLAERFQLRNWLLQFPVKTEEAMDVNSRALEALQGDEEFEPPPRMPQEELKAWIAELNERLSGDSEAPVVMTLENVKAIRTAVTGLAGDGKVNGADAYRMRGAMRKLKSAADGVELEGKAVQADLPEESAEGA